MPSEDEQQDARTGGRHAGPRRPLKPLLAKLHMPAGKAVALAAMPGAVLMGMGFTPTLAQAKPTDPPNPFGDALCATAPDKTPDPSATPSGSPSATPGQSATPRESAEPSRTPEPSPTATTDEGKDARPSPSPSHTPQRHDGKTPAPDRTPAATPTPTPTPTAKGPVGLPLPSLPGLPTLLPLPGQETSAKPTDRATAPTSAPAPGESPSPSGPAAQKPRPTAEPSRTPAAPSESPSASASPSPSASPGESASPTPDATKTPKPCPSATAKANGSQFPDQPWYLETTKLTLTWLTYQGIVDVTTVGGQHKKALKFTASAIDIHNLHQIVNGKGFEYHVTGYGDTPTFRGGQVTLYTEELKGKLLGLDTPLTRVDYSPSSPPPLIPGLPLPIPIWFTDVKLRQSGQFGGNLTVPNMHVYLTPGTYS
ncbi:hypothetical protein [Streptomyces orinoci]|uniref:Uncharacterized protein n=1 Tax=Streptomyces orinoci TaxID=67339 RepID=A0ABV3K6G2_STRON|nr:hypothetical protein [Streptomyces orinoci]